MPNAYDPMKYDRTLRGGRSTNNVEPTRGEGLYATFELLHRAGVRDRGCQEVIRAIFKMATTIRKDVTKIAILAIFTSYYHSFSYASHSFSNVCKMAFGVPVNDHACDGDEATQRP